MVGFWQFLNPYVKYNFLALNLLYLHNDSPDHIKFQFLKLMARQQSRSPNWVYITMIVTFLDLHSLAKAALQDHSLAHMYICLSLSLLYKMYTKNVAKFDLLGSCSAHDQTTCKFRVNFWHIPFSLSTLRLQ